MDVVGIYASDTFHTVWALKKKSQTFSQFFCLDLTQEVV